MGEKEFLKAKLNEALEELTSDFETFDDFKKGMAGSGNFFVYSQVDSKSIPNICKNGADGAKEFFNTMIYGRGLYTVMSYKDCIQYGRSDAMVKYAVKKGAFDNFLIFDMGIRQDLYKAGILTIHEKISTTIKRLFSPSDVKMLEQYYGQGLYKLDDMVMQCNHSGTSNWNQERFMHLVTQGEPNIELHPGMRFNSEKKLDVSNVDGWIYFSGYGSTAIFRTMDLLIPYSYAIKKDYWGKWPPENEFKYCINDPETFDNINVSTDAFRRARKDYPDTKFTEKTVCGFALVRNGKKFNLLNARTNKYFSPLDFDTCQAFDPVTQTAAFSIKTEEDGIIEFMIHSEERGKNVNLYYRQIGTPDAESDWTALSYEDFIDVMNEFKSEVISESVDEVFTHKDFNTFKSGINDSRNVILYSATDPNTAKSIFENGANMEFSGTGGDSSLYYGLGVYTVRNTESLLTGKYGRGVVKYILKDGYKNFLIMDDGVRAKYDPGKTVYDELVALVPKDILDDFDKFLKNGMPHMPSLNNWETQRHLTKNGVQGYRDINISSQTGRTGQRESNTASFARAIKLAMQGKNLHDPLASAIYDELIMAKTKIRGFVFNGGADGNVVMVRDFSGLMPIDYSVDGGRTWIGQFSEDNFNRINQRVDPFYQYRGEYETTALRTKSICGFSMVSGKQGYNYKDIWFHRPLLPIDVDHATPFNPISKTAQFTLCDVTFEIKVDDDLNVWLSYEDEGMMQESSYDEFMEFVKAAQEQGLLGKKKEYPNNLLNPSNDRKK